MGWGSEQITGILGSILNTIGDGISGIGEKLRETAKIVTDSDETPQPGSTKTVHSSPNKSGYSEEKQTNKTNYRYNTKPNAGSSTSETINSDRSKTNSNVAKGKNAILVFGKPCFSTYDQGIRGISFPYTIRINNRQNTPIIVTAKFCTMSGDWIHSNVAELSDNYGDVFIKESLFVDSQNYIKESYLFLPYGVLKLNKTQEICLNLNVFSKRGTGEQILSFTHRFDYFIYEDDPREPQYKSQKPKQTYNKATKPEYFSQPGVEELIGLIAHVIKADGVTAPEEIRTVIEFFNSAPHLDKDKIKERLKYNLSHLPDIEKCCKVLRNNYNTQGLLTFVGLFFNISSSDGRTPYVEIKVIETIALALQIPAASFNALKNSFIPGYRRANAGFYSSESNNDYGTNSSSNNAGDYYDASDCTGKVHRNGEPKQKNSYTSSSSYSSSSSYYNNSGNPLWKMFGLPPTATKAQLKQAYHEKCKLFHPDKFAQAPEAKRKEAEELFKNYQAAYEELLLEF